MEQQSEKDFKKKKDDSNFSKYVLNVKSYSADISDFQIPELLYFPHLEIKNTTELLSVGLFCNWSEGTALSLVTVEDTCDL